MKTNDFFLALFFTMILGACRSTGQLHRYEVELTRADTPSQILRYEVKKDREGPIIKLTGTVRNITTRKPLAFANIDLLHLEKEKTIGGFTNAQGQFSIEGQTGPYKLICKYKGYTTFGNKLVLEERANHDIEIGMGEAAGLEVVEITSSKKLNKKQQESQARAVQANYK